MLEAHHPYILRMLAMQALVDRRSDVLKFCLDRGGFEYESNFVKRSNNVFEELHPRTYKVLQESDFRKQHPLQPHPASEIDVGGKYPVNW